MKVQSSTVKVQYCTETFLAPTVCMRVLSYPLLFFLLFISYTLTLSCLTLGNYSHNIAKLVND